MAGVGKSLVKSICICFSALMMITVLAGCGKASDNLDVIDTQSKKQSAEQTVDKTLVAYYSLSGNTKKAAELIAEKLGADIYEIKVDNEYDPDMWVAWDEAQRERSENDLPKIIGEAQDMSQYDTVIIGGPVWGQTLSNPIMVYLDQNDFADKKVSAFWTFVNHDENYENDFKNRLNGGSYITGIGLSGSIRASESDMDSAISNWIITLQ